MARNINPNIRILARANEPASVDKLYRAGADYVALLPMIGGQIIGRIILADTVTILLDLPNGDIVVMKQIDRKIRTDSRVVHAEGIGNPYHRDREQEPYDCRTVARKKCSRERTP